jgi:FSR family fosmidomycin resistance protein-like MFS transporter
MADPDDGSSSTTRAPSLPSKLLIAMVILSHAMNHFQGGVLPVLYPAIITEFEIDYVQLGVLQFAASFATGFPQLFVAFLRRLISGKVLLGVGNLVSSLFNMAASLTGSVQHFIALRVVSGVGSSPQHPVGASLLTSHTPSAWRGRIFGLNLSVPMVGSTLAPLIGAALLLLVGWRATLLVIAVPVLLVALVTLIVVRERDVGEEATRRRRHGVRGFLHTLRHRNILAISLIRTVMAFRMGIRSFLPLYFIDVLGFSTELSSGLYALLLFGGVIGPFVWGYLSDRMRRKPLIVGVIGASGLLYLCLSVVQTPWGIAVVLFLIGFMVQTVIMQNILAESTAKEQLDQVFGFFYTLGFTLGSFSSVIFGFMAETYGFALAFTYIAAVNGLSMVPAFWLRE